MSDDDCHSPTIYETIVRVLGERHARELTDELWGLGYTVARRQAGWTRDPFHIDPKLIPSDMSYQWVGNDDLEAHKIHGWQPVPASRHDGIFMPLGYKGDIEVSRATLVERPKVDTDKAHADNIAAAHKLVDDWKKKYTGEGFIGHVKVGYDEETAITTAVGENSPGGITHLPNDMVPYASEIFAERDRLRAEAPQPVDYLALTETAIANIRQRRLAS